MVKVSRKEVPSLEISIRKAIIKGAAVYNEGKEQECFEIYLATAYSGLSQQTMHGHGHHDEYTDEQSDTILQLLTQATIDGNVQASASSKDFGEAAWVLRRAFDVILKLSEKKTDDEDGQGRDKEEGNFLANLCNTLSDILDIKEHRHRLQTYPDTFVGDKAVSKLVESHVCMNRHHAVEQMNKLLRFGLLYHVTKEHTFKDERLFYQLASSSDLKLELNKFGNKTKSLRGDEVVHYTAVLGRYITFHKHPSLGVLRLDYDYPPAPGDIDHPDSYEYPVYYRVVPGLTFEMCQKGVLTPTVAAAFDEAVLWLANHKDVSVITGDCGFMFWFVERVRKIASKKCISLSPLMQLPGMAAACGPKDKILVLTANGNSLNPMRDLIKRQCGVDSQDTKFIFVGCEHVPYFGEEVANGSKVNEGKAEPGIVQLTEEMVRKYPNTRMILFECTELPPYSDAVREATRLPVMDAITNCDFFMQAFLDNGKFGLNGWYEEWDGVQEEYVMGQNLDEGQKLQCIWCVKTDVHQFLM